MSHLLLRVQQSDCLSAEESGLRGGIPVSVKGVQVGVEQEEEEEEVVTDPWWWEPAASSESLKLLTTWTVVETSTPPKTEGLFLVLFPPALAVLPIPPSPSPPPSIPSFLSLTLFSYAKCRVRTWMNRNEVLQKRAVMINVSDELVTNWDVNTWPFRTHRNIRSSEPDCSKPSGSQASWLSYCRPTGCNFNVVLYLPLFSSLGYRWNFSIINLIINKSCQKSVNSPTVLIWFWAHGLKEKVLLFL